MTMVEAGEVLGFGSILGSTTTTPWTPSRTAQLPFGVGRGQGDAWVDQNAVILPLHPRLYQEQLKYHVVLVEAREVRAWSGSTRSSAATPATRIAAAPPRTIDGCGGCSGHTRRGGCDGPERRVVCRI